MKHRPGKVSGAIERHAVVKLSSIDALSAIMTVGISPSLKSRVSTVFTGKYLPKTFVSLPRAVIVYCDVKLKKKLKKTVKYV